MNYNLYNTRRENFSFYYNCLFKKLSEGLRIYNMCLLREVYQFFCNSGNSCMRSSQRRDLRRWKEPW